MLQKLHHDCKTLDTKMVWTKTFPMLTLESAIRSLDVNNDTIDDVIVAFGTGLDAAYYPSEVCEIYLNQSRRSGGNCGGGVMALNGLDGSVLWSTYTPHELFAVNCNLDITGDGINDCFIGGRMATFVTIDSSNGNILWKLEPDTSIDSTDQSVPIIERSNFYTPLIIPKDLDGDQLPDLLMIHGGDPLRTQYDKSRIAARILLISSATGNVIQWSTVPDNAESYYSPQLLTGLDGQLSILFGTGGESHPGSLWVISLADLIIGQIDRAKTIYTDCCKGIMVPPVIVDITGDHVADIVMSMFNSSVVAFDGVTFEQIWSKSYEGSETYSTPAIGKFSSNDSTILDVIVSRQFGPGFPIYYHSSVDVLNGRDGKSLLPKTIDMLIGTQSSPLTISTSGSNDLFLFWKSTCISKDGTEIAVGSKNSLKYSLASANIHESSRADFCGLRFANSSLVTQLIALSDSGQSILYDSQHYHDLEYDSNIINYDTLIKKWQAAHPQYMSQLNTGTDSVDPIFSESQSFGGLVQATYLDSPYQLPDGQKLPDDSFWNLQRSRGSFSSPILTRRRYRKKRHVGVHDGGGVQRVISTGTLMASLANQVTTKSLLQSNPSLTKAQVEALSKSPLLKSHSAQSIDVVYGTYWFPPSDEVEMVSPEVRECVDKWMDPDTEAKVRLGSDRSDMDHDEYFDAVMEKCKNSNEVQNSKRKSKKKKLYNLFGKKMGSLTIYRQSLTCKEGGSFKPIKDQIWSGYMGGNNAQCIANV